MLYPEPKYVKATGGKFNLSNVSLDLAGVLQKNTFLIDKEYLFNNNKEKKIIKVEKKELIECYFQTNDISDTLIEEAYGLHVSKENICIYASSDRGIYFALITLNKILRCKSIQELYIFDYPSFNIRGIIEGYYGKPWSMEDRLDAINFISRHKMNTYVYAPKDDDYIRDKWYLLYDKKKIIDILDLYNECKKNKITFCYTISPGLTIKYSSDIFIQKLIDKLNQIYQIGVKNFGLLLDDIPKKLMHEEDKNVFPSLALAHAYLIKKVYTAIKQIDIKCNLIICPTIYHGMGDEEYITDLCNNIPENIDVFWTGREICSSIINTYDSKYFLEKTGRKPLYWDNYPVNDAGMINEMHIGAITNRSKDLNIFSRGFISNVMEYKESSMIPIATISDYLWNSESYDKNKSIVDAVCETAGIEFIEDFISYIGYCSKSCINLDGNEEFINEMTKFRFSIINGESEKAFNDIENYYKQNLQKSKNILKMSNKKLLNENIKWIEKWEKFNEFALRALEYMKSGIATTEQWEKIKELYNEIEVNPIEIMRFETRQMFNSIKIK